MLLAAELGWRGMWIIRATSFEEAQAIVDRDIFHSSGLRTYKLYRWQMNEGSPTLTVNFSIRPSKSFERIARKDSTMLTLFHNAVSVCSQKVRLQL